MVKSNVKKVSVKENFLFNAILNATKFLFPLITYPYAARILLPEGTGKVSFATSLVYYFIMFEELGIPKYGIRKCAMVRDNREQLSRTVHELLAIQTVTTLISFIVFIGCIFAVPKLRAEKLLYFVVSVGLFLHLVGVEWLYQALEQYRYISIRSMAFKVISVAAMFLLIHDQNDYVMYGAISIFASSASYVCNFVRARKLISFRPVGSYNVKQHIKPVLVFFAMACAVSIYTHIDTLMLGFLKGDATVGYYNAAVKVKTVLISLITSLSVVLLPRASYYITQGKEKEFLSISRKSMSFSALVALPLMVYFILYADTAIRFLAGSSYEKAIMPMRLIMPSLFFIGMSYPIGIQVLVPLGKEKTVLYSEIAGAVVNVLVNVALIPRLGVAGAAISNCCAEAAVLLVQYFDVRKSVSELLKDIKWLKIGVAILAGIVASAWVHSLALNEFCILVVSACCFFGAYGITLLSLKEQLVWELVHQYGEKLLHKINKKND